MTGTDRNTATTLRWAVFMVVALTLAAGLFVIAARWRSNQRQSEIRSRSFAALKKLGGTATASPMNPGLPLHRWVDDDVLQHVEQVFVGVDLSNLSSRPTAVKDADLEHLRGLDNLRTLQLFATQVNGSGLAHVPPESLVLLNLGNTPTGNSALQHVQRMNRLETLLLGNTQVGDNGLEFLRDLTTLQELDLHGAQITDVGLQHLAPLQNLKELDLRNTQTTQPGLKELQTALPNCKIIAGPE